MVSLPDVKSGRVNLADIAEVNNYLDMKADIEYAARERSMKGGSRHGIRRR